MACTLPETPIGGEQHEAVRYSILRRGGLPRRSSPPYRHRPLPPPRYRHRPSPPPRYGRYYGYGGSGFPGVWPHFLSAPPYSYYTTQDPCFMVGKVSAADAAGVVRCVDLPPATAALLRRAEPSLVRWPPGAGAWSI